jgi:hypothetical protein
MYKKFIYTKYVPNKFKYLKKAYIPYNSDPSATEYTCFGYPQFV